MIGCTDLSRADRWTTIAWAAAAAAALLWPAHGLGLIDGIPLDGRAEAVLVGVAFPALCWFHPRFLRSRAARVIVVLLCVVKLIDAVALGQQGWCARFSTSGPLVEDGTLLQHTWDARADWRQPVPRCSAIVARAYPTLEDFPIWFLNIPVDAGRPPYSVVRMSIDGYISPRASGTLTIDLEGAQSVRGTIGGQAIDLRAPSSLSVAVPAGPAHVDLDLSMTGGHWRFRPLWNGADIFANVPTSVDAPRALDRFIRPALSMAPSVLPVAFLATWLAAAVWVTRPPPLVTAWVLGLSAICWTAAGINLTKYGRLTMILFLAAPLVPVPRRLRTIRGAFLLLGVPWLALFVGAYLNQIGSITFYTVGDDWLQFQRYAYRIYMQGYWLEGGQKTFWFQPLYRWVVGALHVIFGDSSIGEIYLDAASLLTCSLLGFYLVKREAGFRWGIAAAALSLATFVLGPTWYIIGRGLSEIVSAGFLYLAAFCVLSARRDRLRPALLAALFAVLAFYSRLNNYPSALAVIVFAVSLNVRAAEVWRPVTLWRRADLQSVAIVLFSLAAAIHLLALRTYYYTGIFSPFYGTQRDHLSTFQPNDTIGVTLRNIAGSLLVLMTMQDPPRFDVRAVLLIAGCAIAVLALLRVPGFGAVRFAPAAWCAAGLAGAVLARGTSYVGRFSIHLIPIAVALATAAVARAARVYRPDLVS